jgi:uncharacterized protein (TIGR02266 family)
MQLMPASSPSAFDVQSSLAEFADLNRRRLFGFPPLAVDELERWLELRSLLECHFGAQEPRDWTGIERREFLRLPTHIRIEFGKRAKHQFATVRDVSQGGLFIATRRPLELGSEVQLMLELDFADTPLEVSGTVAWVRAEPRGDEPAGMGISFSKPDPEVRQAISRIVQKAASSD